MPSVTKPQAHLMAACAHGAAYKKCPPLKVARDFNQADKRSGILRRGANGGRATPLESGMDAKLNFGQGHGHNFFSTTPLFGHALGTALGASAKKRHFAEGGEVKQKGPSLKERREIRATIERGRNDAVAALRDLRAQLTSDMPQGPLDIRSSLDDLRGRLAMQDGGDVKASGTAQIGDPSALYQEYLDLLEKLSDPQIDGETQGQVVDRLGEIEAQLEALGINVGDSTSSESVGMADGGAVAELRPIERESILQKILGGYGDALSWSGNKAGKIAKAIRPVTGPTMLMRDALNHTGRSLADSGEAFRDWSAGFSPVDMSESVTQPAVNRQQLADVIGGLPPLAEVSRAAPGAVRSAARDFVRAQIEGVPRITAYHGTPHEFENFDLSKVGSGEGAQAFGHGLYFAESPGVAGTYRTATGYQHMARDFRKSLPDDAGTDDVLDMARAGEFDPKQARVIKALAADDWLGFDYPAQAITAAFKEAALKKGNFELSDELKAALQDYGHLYTVDIPDEHIARMLDWDKSLKDQPETVRKALDAADFKNDPVIAAWKANGAWDHISGQTLYKHLAGGLTYEASEKGLPKAASEYLNSLGIPGLKYLDAKSRRAGEGTRNFVVFDDAIPKVLKRE